MITEEERKKVIARARFKWSWLIGLALHFRPETSYVALGLAMLHAIDRRTGRAAYQQKTFGTLIGRSGGIVGRMTRKMERAGFLHIGRYRGIVNEYTLKMPPNPRHYRVELAALPGGNPGHLRPSLLNRPIENLVSLDSNDPGLDNEQKASATTNRPTEHSLGDAGDRLRSKLGDDVFASWFGEAKIEKSTDKVVTLSVPSVFIKSWISTHFDADILDCWRMVDPAIERVEITVFAR